MEMESEVELKLTEKEAEALLNVFQAFGLIKGFSEIYCSIYRKLKHSMYPHTKIFGDALPEIGVSLMKKGKENESS